MGSSLSDSGGVSRRGFLGSTAVVAAASTSTHGFGVFNRRRATRPAAISSANGIRSVEIAVQKMRGGMNPADAAVLGVEPVENDPDDMSVGYGGLPNEEGVVELDACVMDGPSGLGGAVAGLRNIKNPAQVALKVMRHTDHVLLVTEGALRFARMHGFREENLLTERARKVWLQWMARHSDRDDYIDPEENGPFGKEYIRETGTIHVGCVNQAGDLGGCTTTSGLAFKIPGRVGDSPLLGCGNYVDNDVGAAGSTGRGEAVILSNGASSIVHFMAQGESPTDACMEACKRIARMTKSPRLLDEKGRPNFQVNFYAVNKKGETGAASLKPARHARMTDNGPEIVDSAALFE